jgi:hypothetical protein
VKKVEICLIISFGLIAVLAATSVWSYATIQNHNNSSPNGIQNLQNEISALNSQSTNLQNEISSQRSGVADLNSIIYFQKSETWVSSQAVNETAGSYYSWSFSAKYAGYLPVTIESSTTNNTYVEVIWSSFDVNYSNRIAVGTNGTVVFPILPSNVEIKVGNTDSLGVAIETVTIAYYY